MNYLQMYTNLAIILIVGALVSWIILAVWSNGENRVVLVVSIILSIATLFCAAMAGLLS